MLRLGFTFWNRILAFTWHVSFAHISETTCPFAFKMEELLIFNKKFLHLASYFRAAHWTQVTNADTWVCEKLPQKS